MINLFSPIRTSEEFEEFCVFWMIDLARQRHGAWNPTFQTYGTKGQNQQGLDVLPLHAYSGIVGQCKFWDGVLHLREIEQDLKKSDSYPGRIDHFYVLTTGKRDTEVQQRTSNGYFHMRPDGSSFLVHVEYFDELDPRLLMLTADVRARLADRVPFMTAVLEDRAANSPAEVLRSQQAFRAYMLRNIPPAALDALERSDWNAGQVPGEVLDPFDHVYFEYDRAKWVLDGVNAFAHEGDRAELVAGLLYGRPFLDALSSFREAYINHITGRTVGGVYMLVANDDSRHHQRFSKVGYNERMHMVRLYRTMVLGCPAV